MTVSRRPDLDWLRVLAFGLLIAYHAGMAWSGWSWHLTSIDSIDCVREGMRFVNRWRMPLLFVVSGAASTGCHRPSRAAPIPPAT
jgi:peptidoglycan/LPS O-acetylase OafA/YrhL